MFESVLGLVAGVCWILFGLWVGCDGWGIELVGFVFEVVWLPCVVALWILCWCLGCLGG